MRHIWRAFQTGLQRPEGYRSLHPRGCAHPRLPASSRSAFAGFHDAAEEDRGTAPDGRGAPAAPGCRSTAHNPDERPEDASATTGVIRDGVKANLSYMLSLTRAPPVGDEAEAATLAELTTRRTLRRRVTQ